MALLPPLLLFAAGMAPAPTFRTDSNLVLVNFYAVRDGRAVFDLKREDVRIFEDRAEQPIAVFESPSVNAPGRAQAPLQAIFLLDVSGTVVYNGMFDARMIQSAFLSVLKRRAEVAVYAFAKQCQRLCPLTRDPEMLEAALGMAEGQKHDGTSLYSSIVQVAAELGRSPEAARRVLFVVSDGVPEGDTAKPQQVVDAANQAGVRIFPVLLRLVPRSSASRPEEDFAQPGGGSTGTFARRGRVESLQMEFAGLGRATGGRSFDPDPVLNREVFTRILHSVADQLNVEYTVGYYAQPSAGRAKRRTISVRLTGTSLGTVHGGARSITR